ncbi:LysE family translocator [Devosia sp. SL43]|uniref:LysE family translocator n=1 Tax=Devosia sp. SL43 TaxID=2806348 RepID=UPI001F34AA33|nr:LysE family translocator [Devosia sp. SL43]UJW87555.1 LysE family translocator [Devosia sp. SL43]
MTYEVLTALAVFALVSSITPGPNNLMLMASGVNFGALRTVPHALGVCIGFTLMVGLVGVGLMGVFDAIPNSHQVLKVVSALYLLYLAYKLATTDTLGERAVDSRPMTFFQAALFQWVNPKAWTMALTAMTVYAGGGSLQTVLLVTLVFGVVNAPSISVWVLAGDRLGLLLSTSGRLRAFNIVMAALLVASLYPVLMQ